MSARQEKILYCRHCRAALEAGQQYCAYCGVTVPADAMNDELLARMGAKGFIENFQYVLKEKYVVCAGRASRGEYWKFHAVYFGCLDILGCLWFLSATVFWAAVVSFALLTALPCVCLSIRRFHDLNKSGWWLFSNAIPYVGPFVYIWFLVRAGDEAPNRYGRRLNCVSLTAAEGRRIGRGRSPQGWQIVV